MQTSSGHSRITPEQADDRLSAVQLGTGISYADSGLRQDGDYAPLAFLFLHTLELKFEENCPHAFRGLITQHAAWFQARRGEEYQVSACGHKVIIGSAIADAAQAR